MMLCFVDIAENNVSGTPSGRVQQILYSLPEETFPFLSIQAHPCGELIAYSRQQPNLMCLHRRLYPFLSKTCWAGSMCWNRYHFTLGHALKMINSLSASGQWQCCEASTKVFRKFEQAECISLKDLGISLADISPNQLPIFSECRQKKSLITK